MVENTDASLDFWREKYWDKNFSPWHLSAPHQRLVENKDIFLGPDSVRVLVPFCGKTVDLKWLYEQGHEVVGVEGSVAPIEEFFKESGIEYALNEDGVTYQTADKRLIIVRGNFFTLADDYVHSFDCVWDRAALVAVTPDDRKYFADAVKRLAKDTFRYIIVTTEYDQSKVAGPPFSVTREDISSFYADWAKIKLIGETVMLPDTDKYIPDKFRKANESLAERVYFLEPL